MFVQTIIKGVPPNFAEILRAFPAAKGPNVIFSYGDVIYSKSGGIIPREIKVHESVHGERQNELGIETWWDRYIADSAFCFEEELVAHRAEYRAYCEGPPCPGRHARDRALDAIAGRLAGPLYRSTISLAKARELIR